MKRRTLHLLASALLLLLLITDPAAAATKRSFESTAFIGMLERIVLLIDALLYVGGPILMLHGGLKWSCSQGNARNAEEGKRTFYWGMLLFAAGIALTGLYLTLGKWLATGGTP